MEVLLLGTGGADGWPNPWCTCASCNWARDAGVLRRQTAALVDDVLLIDCGPEAPRAALQHGRNLVGVQHILLTHSHADHLAPAALTWRGWAGRDDPLDVVGPPAAIAACKEWVDPSSTWARFREVRAGDRVMLGSYDVRVVAADHNEDVGPPVLYDIASSDGTRMFWGTDTGPLPEQSLQAMAGVGYDAVFLEESTGDRPFPQHHHFDTWARDVAKLRANGALRDDSRVVAIHLSHFNPPLPEVQRRLAQWGGEVHPDGALVVVGAAPAPEVRPRQRAPHRVLVLGGARSGKSREAERRLLAEPEVTYVATALEVPDDGEWAARLAAHRARRPEHWRTVETTDLVSVLRTESGPLLIDCLTLWLAHLVDSDVDVTAAIDDLVDAWRNSLALVVAVSNEVGSGVVPPTAQGRAFRDALGVLNARLAAEADEVWLVTAGIVQQLR
ncbi:MAG: bifunctional adenosylcobinamide kinase/adenosylcobinamide-phosphate guanylyltransferase [Actinomycetes bacterium]